MLGLLERTVSSIAERLVILSPPGAAVPASFRRVTGGEYGRDALLRQVQRLRGRIYLADGAVQPDDLTADGRHQTAEDDRSWHLVMLDGARQPTACLWYLELDSPASIEDLRIRNSPPAQCPVSREPLRQGVLSELARARAEGVAYAEVGGWASERHERACPAGLLLILATFGLSRILGGALGVTTATARHSSAAILRRLGLSFFPLGSDVVPPYYDSRYRCEMELLRFDTRRADRKYEPLIEHLVEKLPEAPVIAAHSGAVAAPAGTLAGSRPGPSVLTDGAAA